MGQSSIPVQLKEVHRSRLRLPEGSPEHGPSRFLQEAHQRNLCAVDGRGVKVSIIRIALHHGSGYPHDGGGHIGGCIENSIWRLAASIWAFLFSYIRLISQEHGEAVPHMLLAFIVPGILKGKRTYVDGHRGSFSVICWLLGSPHLPLPPVFTADLAALQLYCQYCKHTCKQGNPKHRDP